MIETVANLKMNIEHLYSEYPSATSSTEIVYWTILFSSFSLLSFIRLFSLCRYHFSLPSQFSTQSWTFPDYSWLVVQLSHCYLYFQCALIDAYKMRGIIVNPW